MIKFIYGTDSLEIQNLLRLTEAEFLKLDSAGINLQQLDGAALNAPQFDQAVSTMPFLAPKRLIIVKNFIRDNKDPELKNRIADKIKFIRDNQNVDLLIVEDGEPDKRLRIYKELVKLADIKQINIPQGSELVRWVNSKFKQEKISIAREDTEYLIQGVGANPQRLSTEIDKLCLYARSQQRQEISRADINALVSPDIDPNIFAFTEAITRKDSKTATRLLFEFAQKGESEQKLLGIMAYQFRTLITIKDGLDRQQSPTEIAKLAKISPYVVSKNLPIARSKPIRSFVIMYDQLRHTDSVIKAGEVPADTAVDLLVATLCR